MRPVRRVLVALTLLPWAASASSVPALADDAAGAGGTAGAYVDGSGNPTAEAREVTVTPARSAGSGAASNCTWRVLNADDTRVAMYDADGTRLTSPTGRWLERVCDGQAVAVNGAFAVPEGQRSVDPAVLARQARQSVAIPEPPISTSPRSDRKLYTRVPTWLWIDGGWWRAYSATADAGGVSTTAVATPVRAIWDMGDGGRTICTGPGTPWRPGLPDSEAKCSYLYKNSSAGQRAGTFTMSVTVEFAISWTSSIGPGGGLAPITRSASTAVQVGEIQAIETE